MAKPDFSQMNKTELRTYVLSNRSDNDAFHAYMDKLHERSPLLTLEPGEVLTQEQLEEVLRQKRQLNQELPD